MTKVLGLFTVLLVVASATSMAQEQEVWVTVVIKGKPVMGGLPIRGFEFAGRRESESYRVLVSAIVATQELDSQGLCSEGTGFKRVEFADLRVKAGQELTIPNMKDAGMTPWVVRAGRKEATRASQE